MRHPERHNAQHQCNASLKTLCRVYKDGDYNGILHPGWALYKPTGDYEDFEIHLRFVAPIDFCPYCGQKLEANND